MTAQEHDDLELVKALVYRIFFTVADPATTDPATAKAYEPWAGQIFERLAKLQPSPVDLSAIAAAIGDMKAGQVALNAKVDALAGLVSKIESALKSA